LAYRPELVQERKEQAEMLLVAIKRCRSGGEGRRKYFAAILMTS
jgi:hypothetical protein